MQEARNSSLTGSLMRDDDGEDDDDDADVDDALLLRCGRRE